MPHPWNAEQQATVGARLAAFVERALPACDVRVEYDDGVAHLSGTVPTPTAREAIADLVAADDFVESVVNDIAVSPDTSLAADSTRAARRRPADRR